MTSSSEENDIVTLTPTEIQETAKAVAGNLLPEKSCAKYKKGYQQFISWKNDKKAYSFSESVMLVYFNELGKTYKPSTLWGIYSMLKATINVEHNINIKGYTKLTTLLKRLSSGFKCKKSKVLTAENVETFLREAPDEIYLAVKVALIFGVNGACRAAELVDLKTSDIEEHNDMILVKLSNTKTKVDRSFVIRDEFYNIVKKYQSLRPENIRNDRFFINYIKGKCTIQPIGRHKLAATPKTIATFLKLPNSESYTGHCFRRTSATLLADSGANLTTLKRHGGWASDKVAEGYIEDSVKNKVKINNQINEDINLRSAPSHTATSSRPATSKEDFVSLSPPPPKWFDNDNMDNIQTNSLPTEMTQNMNINVPGKNTSLSFNNCPHAYININFY